MCYVPLHNHSEFSFFDGYSSPAEMAERAKELNMTAIALTDHGTLNGVVRFVDACNEYGIKPIIGSELYWTPDMFNKDPDTITRHLVVWAADNEGYRNLMRLNSMGHLEGEVRRGPNLTPRIDDRAIEKYAKGLIASSSCLNGRIPKLLLEGRIDEAVEVTQYYAKLFEYFVLELQPHEIEEQYRLNYLIVKLAELTGLPLIVTTDSHYACQGDADYQDVFFTIKRKDEMDDPNRFKLSGGQSYWIQDADYIRKTLMWDRGNGPEPMPHSLIEEALAGTHQVADRCNVQIELGVNRMPEFPVEDGQDPTELLIQQANEGLFSRILEDGITDVEAYKERLDYELEVIIQKGYVGYFLIVGDIVRTGKDKMGILFGPGRGSAGGSVLAWALRITEVDPIKHNLLFERFLNPERESPPDIDIDIPDDRRDELIAYIKGKYGEDHVAQIANNNTMGAKDAFKRTAKAFGVSHQDAERLSKRITADRLEDETDSVVVDFLNKHPRIRDAAIKMQNRVISKGRHAAGIVISPDPILNHTALQRAKDGTITTQADMADIERLGLLKIDALSLKTLKVISHALRLAKRPDITHQTLYKVDVHNPEIYKYLRSGRTEAIFQIESGLMKRIIEKIKPTSFEDLVAILSIGRPGPAAMTDPYARRKHKMEAVSYPHPKLEPVLKNTYGIMIYQEQVMQAAQVLAGYTLGQADILRRAMGKKKADVMESEKNHFITGCWEYSQIAETVAAEIWNLINQFAGYGFNKSHAVAYAIISVWTTLLKIHMPAAYWTAVLSNEVESNAKDRDEKILLYANEARRDGVEFLCPDINESAHWFTLHGDRIRWGLSGVKGIGAKGVEDIITQRPYKRMIEVAERCDRRSVTKASMKALIFSGAFDELEKKPRVEIWHDYLQWRRDQKMPVNDSDYIEGPYTKEQCIQDEMKILGVSISNQSDWNKAEVGAHLDLRGTLTGVREHRDRNGNLMAFATLETEQGDKIRTVIFASVYSNIKSRIKEGAEVTVHGKKDKGGGLILNGIDGQDASKVHRLIDRPTQDHPSIIITQEQLLGIA